ncbi:hypothetical protein TVAG_061230 [Trichomonas vaginalis G3]|uniref:Uncharacterized protein n=1 Tax=Trichomonas vaginalis (strain ATCC PRA-98 / G3) TaxID=412133 RepID=A2GD54_TRIV3|nr:hypothetical protein TVAGG3_0315610 [Trichomonas vaginalis G3]EAX84914.1 hypothetical protein TVAG_061230 [Trichomonas vaginalis G3]KAI5528929.1 hypothetical protein TVAGG3_0315610 [Trichomonas vaginalis G3]|eukprot:XP_001297844.1 hypothetical protein [Trichomonas vaginalis G3]
MDFFKPLEAKKDITILNKNDLVNIRYGGDELSSYIQLRLIIQEKKTHADNEILGNLAFIKINTDSLYILEPDDYIILRITKTYDEFTIASQEPEILSLKLGESAFIHGLLVGTKLSIELLPFMPYKTTTGFSWIYSHLALFYPITPPLRYFDPDFPFVSTLRAFMTGQETDLRKISDIFFKFQLKNYPSELFQPKKFFRDEGPHYNEIEFDEGFLDKWMECFSRETGFSYTIIYGIPFVDYSKDKVESGLESVKSDIICFRADITFTQKVPQNIFHIKSVPYYLVSSTFSQGINVGAQIVYPCGNLTQIVHIVDQFMLLNTSYFLPVIRKFALQPRKIPLTFIYVSAKLFNRINVFHIQSPFYCLNNNSNTSVNETNKENPENSESKTDSKSDKNSESKSDNKSDENTDDPKIELFYPEEAYMPAIPSFYPVGKNPKSIFVPKSVISGSFQIIYAEDWKGEFTPVIVTENTPSGIKKNALPQFKWYQVISKVLEEKVDSEKENIFNKEGKKEFPNMEYKDFKKIIGVNIDSPESNKEILERFCTRNYRLVKIFNKQITKIFCETDEQIPMPINGLALVRIHQVKYKATQTNYLNEDLTIVNFIKKKPFGNPHIVENVRQSMVYKLDHRNLDSRQKKLDISCENTNIDPDVMINNATSLVIIPNVESKPTPTQIIAQ